MRVCAACMWLFASAKDDRNSPSSTTDEALVAARHMCVSGVEILDRRMQLGGQFWIGARQMTLQSDFGSIVHMLTRP
jgi:hypothetical protein